MQRVSTIGINLLFSTFKKSVSDPIWASSAIFHSNPVQAKSLFFYSLDDDIGPAGDVERVVLGWRALGHPDVRRKVWPVSKHVLHLREHPEEYTEAVHKLLEDISLPSQRRVDKDPSLHQHIFRG